MNKKIIFISVLALFALGGQVNADAIGQNQKFFISTQYDAQARSIISTTLRHVSDRAYFYVSDDYWNSVSQSFREQILEQTKSLAQEFDSRIYPIEVEFFGSEPNPGIDGDNRITILLTPLKENAGGYFDTAHQYPKLNSGESNEREMVYLNIAELADQTKMKSFLAHEFQHLISFNQKEKLRQVSDDIWLNELRSEYAVNLLGYNEVFNGSSLERRLAAFLASPSDVLTEWNNLVADYGQINLLSEYIAEHWSPRVIADTLKNNMTGITSINESLVRNGYGERFIDIYRSWLLANIVNESTQNAKFAYKSNGLKDFHVKPNWTVDFLNSNTSVTIADKIKDWQARWYDITHLDQGEHILKISFSSPSLTSFLVSYAVFKNDKGIVTGTFSPNNNSNVLYIDGAGVDFNRIVLMPIKKDKFSGFTNNEASVSLATSIDSLDSVPQGTSVVTISSMEAQNITVASPSLPPTIASPPSPMEIPDGSLVRADGDYRVYIIKGNWLRHITSSKVFGFYRGLGFEKVKIIPSSVLANYKESNLVRFVNSQRVYEVDSLGVKHWLDMSGDKFMTSGRAWDSIFLINDLELNFYKSGPAIKS